jgi:hypothetical protein
MWNLESVLTVIAGSAIADILRALDRKTVLSDALLRQTRSPFPLEIQTFE